MRLATLVRRSVRGAAALILAVLVAVPVTAGPPAATGPSADLLDRWFTWNFGGRHPDHKGNTKFLPLPAGEQTGGNWTAADPAILEGEIDVTLKKNQSFVLPLVAWTQEVYADGSVDPFLPDAVFTDSRLVLKIDGRTVLDTRRGDDLSGFYVGPTALDHPVAYDEPTSYGSVGLVGFQGIGIVLGPLPVGEHTMTLESELITTEPFEIGVQFVNTWNITVTR